MSKLSTMGHFWQYMKKRKKWWLAPIVLILVILGLIMVFAEGSAVAPFIYALF